MSTIYYPNVTPASEGGPGQLLVQPATVAPASGTFAISSSVNVTFMVDKRDTNGSKIPGQTENVSGVVVLGLVPGFNSQTGQFDLNHPDLVAGVIYQVTSQPNPVSFLVQGLRYQSGRYIAANSATLPATYNGNGSLLPSSTTVSYTFTVKDAMGNLIQSSASMLSTPAVSGPHAELDLARLRSILLSPINSQPFTVTVDYSFATGGHTVVSKAEVQVYYAANEALIGGKLAARVATMMGGPGTYRSYDRDSASSSSTEAFGERPPIIIIVDQL
jgi:hypothetical protein